MFFQLQTLNIHNSVNFTNFSMGQSAFESVFGLVFENTHNQILTSVKLRSPFPVTYFGAQKIEMCPAWESLSLSVRMQFVNFNFLQIWSHSDFQKFFMNKKIILQQFFLLLLRIELIIKYMALLIKTTKKCFLRFYLYACVGGCAQFEGSQTTYVLFLCVF